MKTQTMIVAGVIVVVAAVVAVVGINSIAKGDCEEAVVEYRKEKHKWIDSLPFTPFNSGQIERFKGLDYYPIDCRYVVEGILKRKSELVGILDSDSNLIQLTKYGIVSVRIKDTSYTLEVFEAGDLPEFKKFSGIYFIPFWDETALLPDTAGTFEKGRYLIVDIPKNGDTIELDFNMAINSFNAYRDSIPCLITPPLNILAAPLAVGERKYEDRSD